MTVLLIGTLTLGHTHTLVKVKATKFTYTYLSESLPLSPRALVLFFPILTHSSPCTIYAAYLHSRAYFQLLRFARVIKATDLPSTTRRNKIGWRPRASRRSRFCRTFRPYQQFRGRVLSRGRGRYRGVHPFLSLLPPNGVAATVPLVHRKPELKRSPRATLRSSVFLFPASLFSLFIHFYRDNINLHFRGIRYLSVLEYIVLKARGERVRRKINSTNPILREIVPDAA